MQRGSVVLGHLGAGPPGGLAPQMLQRSCKHFCSQTSKKRKESVGVERG